MQNLGVIGLKNHKSYKYGFFSLIKLIKQIWERENMSEMVVVRSKIKEHAQGCNVSGDFAEALNKEVVGLIKKAADRAKANNRKTVSSRDL